MKRLLLFFIFQFSFLSFNGFAQENTGIGEPLISSDSIGQGERTNDSQDEPKTERLKKSLFFTFGPKIMLNTDDATKSAPSPVMYSVGIGGDFTFKNKILAQAHASFFTNYYLWDGEKAQPAEVENRTGTALSSLIDLTGGYTFSLGKSKNHLVSLAGGAGFLVRYAFLSGDVEGDDVNPQTGTKASDDISDINGDFYSNLNFFYPEILLSYSYILSDNWKIGAEFRTYIPLGSISSGNGMDSMIFSFAAKLAYK